MNHRDVEAAREQVNRLRAQMNEHEIILSALPGVLEKDRRELAAAEDRLSALLIK